MNDWRIRSRRHLVRYPSDAEVVAMIRWAERHGKVWSKHDLVARLDVSVDRALQRLLRTNFLRLNRESHQTYVRGEKPVQKPRRPGGRTPKKIELSSVIEQLDQGLSVRKIAHQIGISDDVILKRLEREEGIRFLANDGYRLGPNGEDPRAYHLSIR